MTCPARLRSAAVALCTGATVAALTTGCSGTDQQAGGPRPQSSKSSSTYGGLPTFLPTLSTDTDRLMDASAARPALASQGEQVKVALNEGSVLATVTGPETPGQGLVPEPNATYATWTVELSGATAPIPLNFREFVAVDQTGRPYHPKAVQAAAPLPKTLQPGQDLTFKMQALMATGEGVMRWSPDGGLAPVQWDFEVEVD